MAFLVFCVPPFLLFLCSIQENSWIIFLLIMAAIFWIYRLVKVFCNVLSYWEIRQFYIKALKIRMVRRVLHLKAWSKMCQSNRSSRTILK